MINVLIDCEKSFTPKAYYVLETFFTYYPLKYNIVFKNVLN